MRTSPLARRVVALAVLLSCIACVAPTVEAPRGAVRYADARQEWAAFGDGQCAVAVQRFYAARFGAYVPVPRGDWAGQCAPGGACHLWLDAPLDPATWERVPDDGHATPVAFDLLVYPPTEGNPYGHVASVDHVGDDGEVYVMDSNWNGDERRASSPHTAGSAYGWFRLRPDARTPAPDAKAAR